MIDPIILIQQVAVLLLLMVPGYLLARFKLAGEEFGKSVSNVVLYAAQPGLIIAGFVSVDFDPPILLRMLAVFLLAICVHFLFYGIASLIFKRAPLKKKSVLIFSTVFTNAGYMGIPLLEALFASRFPEISIYAAVYIFAFNIFCWSLGAYLYTSDKKYISVKKMILNPATISTFFGLVIFLLSAFPPIRDLFIVPYVRSAGVIHSIMNSLKALVAPLSMLLIGFRLASIHLEGIWRDKYIYINILTSLLLTPTLVYLLLKLLSVLGIYDDALALSVLLISSAAPAATATGMFAEKYDGDTRYASMIVSVTSVLCILTMPLISLLTLL